MWHSLHLWELMDPLIQEPSWHPRVPLFVNTQNLLHHWFYSCARLCGDEGNWYSFGLAQPLLELFLHPLNRFLLVFIIHQIPLISNNHDGSTFFQNLANNLHVNSGERIHGIDHNTDDVRVVHSRLNLVVDHHIYCILWQACARLYACCVHQHHSATIIAPLDLNAVSSSARHVICHDSVLTKERIYKCWFAYVRSAYYGELYWFGLSHVVARNSTGAAGLFKLIDWINGIDIVVRVKIGVVSWIWVGSIKVLFPLPYKHLEIIICIVVLGIILFFIFLFHHVHFALYNLIHELILQSEESIQTFCSPIIIFLKLFRWNLILYGRI